MNTEVCPICKGYGGSHSTHSYGDRNAPLKALAKECGAWAVYEPNDLPRWPIVLSQPPTQRELNGPNKPCVVAWRLTNPQDARQNIDVSGLLILSNYIRLPHRLSNIETILNAIK